MELPFDAYNNKIDCTVTTPGGSHKQLDLAGYMLIERKAPVFVECKRYSSASIQYTEFVKFLAISYGHTAQEYETFGTSRFSEYYWVTYHPFNLRQWKNLETYDHMKLALTKYPEYLVDETFNESLAHEIASRITVLVFNPKQENLALTRTELESIRHVLNRKAKTL